MRRFFKASAWVFFIFLLSGCIGENYDFTPPNIELYVNNGNASAELKDIVEANVDWIGEENKPYQKEVKDILLFAKKQKKMILGSGYNGDIIFDHEDFELKEMTVFVWKENEKQKVELKNRTMFFPNEKGDYVLEINIESDSGTAQYVGNLAIE